MFRPYTTLPVFGKVPEENMGCIKNSVYTEHFLGKVYIEAPYTIHTVQLKCSIYTQKSGYRALPPGTNPKTGKVVYGGKKSSKKASVQSSVSMS